MTKQNKDALTKEAENLVRRALERSAPAGKQLDEETIRRVAEKVAKSVPPYPERRRAA
jgi:hypothetical protein